MSIFDQLPSEEQLEAWIHVRSRRTLAAFVAWMLIGAAILGATVSVVSWFAKDILVHAVEQRLPVRFAVQDVALGFRGVHLGGVSVRPRINSAIRMELGDVEVRTAWLGWLSGALANVRDVEMDDVLVQINVTDPKKIQAAVTELRSAWRSQPGSRSKSAPEACRSIAIEELSVRVRDNIGTLVRLDAAETELSRGHIEAVFGKLHLGGAPYDEVVAERGVLALDRENSALHLRRFSVDTMDVFWARRGAAAQNPQKDAPNGHAENGTPSALWARLRAFQALIRTQAPSPTGPVPHHDLSSKEALVTHGASWLDPDVLMELGHARVRSATEKGPQTILSDLSLRVRGQGQGTFHAQGTGKPSKGGELGWNLTLKPAELLAQGTLTFHRISLGLLAPFLVDIPWHEPERSDLYGELVLENQGAEKISFRGQLDLKDAALFSKRIAPQPVHGISLRWSGSGVWQPRKRRLEIAESSVGLGGATALVSGSLEWAPEHYLVALRAALPPIPCQVAGSAIPADLLGEFTGFAWQGQIGARLESNIDSRALDQAKLDLNVADACEFTSVPAAADVTRFLEPFFHRVLEPDEKVFEMETGPGSENWTPISVMSPFFVHAVLSHEDGGFFGHHGFSPRSIRDALVQNLKEKRYVKGASTITMQLVKNLFLKREKTLARKVQEALLTWWVEKALRKHEILELYLNVIEYGPGVYGVRNAARYYFGQTPQHLTPAQSIFLATVLPNPKVYSRYLRRGTISEGWAERMRRILNRMYTRGFIDDVAFQYGSAELVQFTFAPTQSLLPMGQASPLPFQPGYAEAKDSWDKWWEQHAPEEPEDSESSAAEEFPGYP